LWRNLATRTTVATAAKYKLLRQAQEGVKGKGEEEHPSTFTPLLGHGFRIRFIGHLHKSKARFRPKVWNKFKFFTAAAEEEGEMDTQYS